jgi:hypothetical protein
MLAAFCAFFFGLGAFFYIASEDDYVIGELPGLRFEETNGDYVSAYEFDVFMCHSDHVCMCYVGLFFEYSCFDGQVDDHEFWFGSMFYVEEICCVMCYDAVIAGRGLFCLFECYQICIGKHKTHLCIRGSFASAFEVDDYTELEAERSELIDSCFMTVEYE